LRPLHFLPQCFSHGVVNAHVREKSPTAIRPEMLEFRATKFEIIIELDLLLHCFQPTSFAFN
jgi:hypothetical protein